MRPCSVLDDLIDSIESGDSQKVTRLDLIGRKIDKVRGSLLPSESCASLNEIDVELLLVLGRFSSEERKLGVGANSAQKDRNCFQ